MTTKYKYKILDDEFNNEEEMIDVLNILGHEGWLVIEGTFKDHCEQYSSTDIDWSIICKMLLVREE